LPCRKYDLQASVELVAFHELVPRFLKVLIHFIEETLPDRGAARSSCPAVRADILMSSRYCHGLASRLDVGVGLCSGEDFVGNVGGGGFKDFTAVGDVTNTAARLTAMAKAGEILACASTYEAVGSTIWGVERLELTLKGKEVPVACYTLPRILAVAA
jgi:class 3 adenylate cyclase